MFVAQGSPPEDFVNFCDAGNFQKKNKIASPFYYRGSARYGFSIQILEISRVVRILVNCDFC